MLKFKWETEFKGTEVGEVPKAWEERVLESIITNVQKGTKPKKVQRKGRLLPYLSAKYLRGETSEANMLCRDAGVLVNKNDIIVLWDGDAGEIFKGRDGLLSSTMGKFTPKKDTDVLFLFYSLKIREDELRDTTTGTSVPHLDKQKLLNLKIIYPSPPEQSRIATVLSWFDNLIENKKRQNEILEETAMAIFKNWFIDFKPFKSGKFVDSELGKIPEGWEVKPIGKLAQLRNGISYSSKEKFEDPVEGSFVFITLNNVVEGGGFKTEYAWIKSDRLKDHHFLEKGDLILTNVHFGVGGSEIERLLATPALVTFPADYKQKKGAYSMDITKISPFERNYNFYLYLYLKLTREDSSSFSTGTSILHLDLNNFRKNKLIISPPQTILQKFHSLVESLFQKIVTNQKQIMVLRKVRDALLPLLVFGKLRVESI